VLNSAARLYVGGKVGNLADSVELARSVQQRGKAIDLLNRVIAFGG